MAFLATNPIRHYNGRPIVASYPWRFSLQRDFMSISCDWFTLLSRYAYRGQSVTMLVLRHKYLGWVLCLSILILSQNQARAEDTGASVERGQAKSTLCVACHGTNGVSPNPAQWPHLAGQGFEYMLDQLLQIRDGGEDARKAPLMTPLIQSYSDQDLADVALYYASFPSAPPVVATEDEKVLTLGRNIYRGGISATGTPACAACHGPNGRGNAKAKFPALVGQDYRYLLTQLERYRSGERPGSTVMSKAVQRVTTPELRAVALYLQSLH